MKSRDEILLLKVKDETEFLLEVMEGHDLHNFLDDRELQYIVSMALIKIGESCSITELQNSKKNIKI
jgi:uncharacterized protein with HEPN domain